jgi:hypothetical protein
MVASEDEMDSEDEMLSQLLDNFEQGGPWATAKGEDVFCVACCDIFSCFTAKL